MQANINLRALQAVSYAMATLDIRYYLNGALVEWTPQQTILAATDGHRLHVARYDAQNEGEGRIIVPNNVVKRMLAPRLVRVFDKNPEISFTLTQEDEKWWYYDYGLEGAPKTQVRPIEGTFPDWRKAVPRVEETEARSAFDLSGHYLADAQQACRDLMGKGWKRPAHRATYYDKAVLIQDFGSSEVEFVGVIMGLIEGEVATIPDWAK